MKKALVILLAAISAGAFAADWENAEVPFDGTRKMADKMTVEWVTVDNIQSTCEAESRRRGNNGFGYPVHACTFWTKYPQGYVCTIYTKKNPTMHTMGHEVRHCFQGNYH